MPNDPTYGGRQYREDGSSYPPPVIVNVSQPGKGPNHVLHAILSVITGGVWLVPWAFITWRAGRRG